MAVPSASMTLRRVRSIYPPLISVRGYATLIGPSSASLPAGQLPPIGNPARTAASRAARSAPVCPPLMTFESICRNCLNRPVSCLWPCMPLASLQPSLRTEIIGPRVFLSVNDETRSGDDPRRWLTVPRSTGASVAFFLLFDRHSCGARKNATINAYLGPC